MTDDERFMTRALELASEPAYTSPNPRVGAVVVRDGQIISEGIHEGSGRPHAEAVALQDVDARGATIYVNLEPCIHHGRTPPCAPALIEAGIYRAVVAMEDPDERVAGKGIALLREAGVTVDVGERSDAARELNHAYIHQRTTGSPLVTVKLALSLDGKMAAVDGSSRWITGEIARRRVHARRVEVDAVLVGAGTVLADDPLLTARDVAAPRQPVRVVCDSRGRVPATSQIFGRGEAIVMTTTHSSHSVKTRWKEVGAEVVVVPEDAGGEVDLASVLETLGERGWLEVYCEGGARMASSLLRNDLVDRLEINYGPVLLGGDAIGLADLGVETMAEATRWHLVNSARMGDDVLVVYERGR